MPCVSSLEAGDIIMMTIHRGPHQQPIQLLTLTVVIITTTKQTATKIIKTNQPNHIVLLTTKLHSESFSKKHSKQLSKVTYDVVNLVAILTGVLPRGAGCMILLHVNCRL